MDAKLNDRLEKQGYETIEPVAGSNEVPPQRTRFNLSPLNRRRLSIFKSNKRGYWSFWIFLTLFFITLFAEAFSNDKPLMLSYKGSWYFPVLKTYSETEFGGEFATEADYRDPTVACFIRTGGNEDCYDTPLTAPVLADQSKGWMIWPLIPYAYDTVNLDYPAFSVKDGKKVPAGFPAPPTWMESGRICNTTVPLSDDEKQKLARYCQVGNFNWLGTDDQGRDVLARIIYGFRISVLFGLVLTLASSVIGVSAGAVQGYFGGWTDLIFQRFIEIWTSVPQLYLLIIIASIITPSFWILLGILLLFSWVALVGVVRAEFLRARNFEYVSAARALGLSNGKIMFRHLLPNAMVATLTFMPFILNSSITMLTSLDFLGFGLPPGSPSLGELLAQGKANISAPWLGLTAFFVIALMLSLLVFIGEAVRDALDPRKTFE